MPWKTTHWIITTCRKVFKVYKPNIDTVLTKVTNNQLTGFADASFAEELDGRKSTTGKLLFWGNNLISFKCKQQSIVATSSCEAELIAINDLALEIEHKINLLDELGFPLEQPAILYTDSLSALHLIMNQGISKRSRAKHIDLRRYKILELFSV